MADGIPTEKTNKNAKIKTGGVCQKDLAGSSKKPMQGLTKKILQGSSKKPMQGLAKNKERRRGRARGGEIF